VAANHHMLRWLKTVVVSDVERRPGGVRRQPHCQTGSAGLSWLVTPKVQLLGTRTS